MAPITAADQAFLQLLTQRKVLEESEALEAMDAVGSKLGGFGAFDAGGDAPEPVPWSSTAGEVGRGANVMKQARKAADRRGCGRQLARSRAARGGKG